MRGWRLPGHPAVTVVKTAEETCGRRTRRRDFLVPRQLHAALTNGKSAGSRGRSGCANPAGHLPSGYLVSGFRFENRPSACVRELIRIAGGPSAGASTIRTIGRLSGVKFRSNRVATWTDGRTLFPFQKPTGFRGNEDRGRCVMVREAHHRRPPAKR